MLKSESPLLQLHLVYIKPEHLGPSRLNRHYLTNWLSNLLSHALQGADFFFNPSNAELNPICHMPALLEAHHILHVSRIRVKDDKYSASQDIAEY